MAQAIFCDQCDEGRLAFVVVSFYNTPVTEAVCLPCLPQWLVDLTGAIKGLPNGEEVVSGMMAAMAAAHLPEQAEEAPKEAPEAPQTAQEAPDEQLAFPGTARVVKSTHGHRKTRSSPPEDGEAAAETSAS